MVVAAAVIGGTKITGGQGKIFGVVLGLSLIHILLIGLVLGLCNAVLISWLKLPPFIITLGTQNLFHGIMTTFISDKSFGAGVLPSCLRAFGQATIFRFDTASGTVGLTICLL